MSVKSANSVGEAPAGGSSTGEVVCSGYLKKLKTMKKKWFILRAESADSSARLEYHDSEKKYRQNPGNPKRSIFLKACFNINRRLDTKHKHVIALYTKDDCFCVVLDTEKDLECWLKSLLSLQRGEDVVDGETPKPTFGQYHNMFTYNIHLKKKIIYLFSIFYDEQHWNPRGELI